MKPQHLLFALVLLATADPVAAQRPDYVALRDSLSALRDVPLLYRLERGSLPVAGAASAEPLVRRGLVALRIWEVTSDRADADRARDLFEQATERFATEPWTHYGLALALARGPDVRVPSPGGVLDGVTVGQSLAEIVGRDPRSRARRALRKALEVDKSFAAAAVLLSDLAVADGGRSRDLITEARDALLAVQAAGGVTSETARALADMQIALGNYAAANAAAGSSPADAGTLRAQGVALMLQPGKIDEGAAAYWRGVEQLTADAAEHYFDDIEVLVLPAEAADWRVADLAGRRLWIDRFWQGRAAEGGVTVAERLAEHYARLARARARYVRNSMRGTDGQGILLAGTTDRFPFDDRGVVMIRHGEPLAVTSTGQRAVLPNETWVYDLPGHGRQLFHFVALRGTQSYSLVNDLLQAIDGPAAFNIEERNRAVVALVADRAPYDPRYQAIVARLRQTLNQYPLLDLNGTEVRSMLERPDADYRRGARAALRFDSFERRYTADLPFYYDVFTFRTREARTDLTAAFALPAGNLEARAENNGVVYDVRMSVIVVDTLIDVVTRRDTVHRVRLARPLAENDFLHAHLTMPALPSEHAVYRVVAEDMTSRRGRIELGSRPLRDFTSNALMISDVVLAYPDSAGDWHRGDARLALLLPRRFAPDRPFTIFYELYNLPAESGYTTRITVQPVEGGGVMSKLRGLFGRSGNAVDVRFDDVARTDRHGHVQETRRLASNLANGRYRLAISVSTRDGRTVSTATEFTVQN